MEELGYKEDDLFDNSNENWLYCNPITWDGIVISGEYTDFNEGEVDYDESLEDYGIDCGTNEQLFIALAALREDSDKFQWFCDDEEAENKSLFFCEYDDVNMHIHNEMDGWNCEGFHKATPAELIEHFKAK